MLQKRTMIAKIAFLCLLTAHITPSLLVRGQESDVSVPSFSMMSFENAQVSQAGPDSFYVRSVEADGEFYSLRLVPAADGGLEVAEVLPERENLLPPDTILDFATIMPQPDGSILIDGVIIENQSFSGLLEVAEDNRVTLGKMLTVTEQPTFQRTRFDPIANLLRPSVDLADDAADGTEDRPIGEDVGALVRERDALQTEVTALTSRNQELVAEVEELQDRVSRLAEENSTLREDLQSMTAEAERLRRIVEAETGAPDETPGQAQNDSDTGDPGGPSEAPDWRFPGDYVRTADLRAAAAAVANELSALSQRIQALERSVAEISTLPPQRATPPETDSAPLNDAETPSAPVTREEAQQALDSSEQAERIAMLQAEVAALQAENEELRNSQRVLEGRVVEEVLNHSLVALMRDQMSRTLVSDFSDVAADTGTWDFTNGRAVQEDRNAYFAKAALSAAQTQEITLYSVEMESLEPTGWVGVGLHLYVSGVEKRRGYGMGSSLLVWLTRDPAVRGTNATYLQLYRSDDDIVMERVLDAEIEEPLNESLLVEVLYEPRNQYITVAVNGEDKVRYRTWFGIDSGVELALRSLGRAEFSNLRVSSAE